MNLSAALEKDLNDQIHLEFESVYVYLQMAADFQRQNLEGFSHWMRLQADEEWSHAMKFHDFVLSRGGSVQLQAISAPVSTDGAPIEAFERALAHEQRVSRSISELYAKALSESDFASLPILQWFVNEQIEEEATVDSIVAQLRMVGDDSSGILFLDRELGARGPEAAAQE